MKQLIRKLHLIPFVAFLFVPALCHAEDTCLWLNAATAAGILGGDVRMTVVSAHANQPESQVANAISSSGPVSANATSTSYSGNGMDDSDCTFVRQQGPGMAELRIEVRTVNNARKQFASDSARCGVNPTALKAIGNEAIICSAGGKSRVHIEQTVGRVRDRIFFIRLKTNGSSLTRTSLREKTRSVSELVAGNLF